MGGNCFWVAAELCCGAASGNMSIVSSSNDIVDVLRPRWAGGNMGVKPLVGRVCISELVSSEIIYEHQAIILSLNPLLAHLLQHLLFFVWLSCTLYFTP